MARGVNLADLAALPNDATLVADQEITANENNAHRRKVQSLVNGLVTGLRDKESCYAGSGQPIGKRQGKVYLDTDDSLYKGYRTTAGTPQKFLDAVLSYAQELSTAGTATFKLGGAINVDTNNVTVASGAGDLMVYSVPANTLNKNNRIIESIDFGSKDTASSTVVGHTINTDVTGLGLSLSASTTSWIMKSYIVRTGDNSQKAVLVGKINRDDAGSSDFVNLIDMTEDSLAIFEIQTDRSVGTCSVTQEARIDNLL